MPNSINNKRIAKNTLLLYIRMFIMLIVGLYTSRVVLNILGVTDYGIYNIIGGVVVLFSFLNNALISATQRFLNFYLGKDDLHAVQKVFCMSMNSYIILSAIFLFLAESIGLWFVETQLNIPEERMQAALWVYQFTIITFIVNLIKIPYNASIIAYEQMDFYAYVSLIEVILKLLVVYLLYITTLDKLILYSLFYTLVPILMVVIYKLYCNKKFMTTKYIWIWDKTIFRNLFSFSGWSLFGSAANMTAQQGLNILINMFFGVTANAAVGIANQVSSHVFQFISNFQIAFQPQIVKTYAANQISDFHKLIFRSAKFSYFMMFILSLPIWLTTNNLLHFWLGKVPEYTAIFCQLILGFLIIESITAPLWMSVQATGKIKRYQIWMAICIFLNFPITYITFKLGFPVYAAWIVRIIVNLFTFVVRCFYMKKYLNFPIYQFVKAVIYPIILVSITSIPIPLCTTYYLGNSFVGFCIIVLTSIIICSFAIFKLGLEKEEKEIVKSIIYKKFIKQKHGNNMSA